MIQPVPIAMMARTMMIDQYCSSLMTAAPSGDVADQEIDPERDDHEKTQDQVELQVTHVATTMNPTAAMTNPTMSNAINPIIASTSRVICRLSSSTSTQRPTNRIQARREGENTNHCGHHNRGGHVDPRPAPGVRQPPQRQTEGNQKRGVDDLTYRDEQQPGNDERAGPDDVSHKSGGSKVTPVTAVMTVLNCVNVNARSLNSAPA